MSTLQGLCDLLDEVSDDQVTEYPDRLEISVEANTFQKLNLNFSEWLEQQLLSIAIDREALDEWDEISDFPDDSECFISIPKDKFLLDVVGAEVNAGKLIFFSLSNFNRWLCENKLPLSSDHPINKNEKNVIWVRGLGQSVIGGSLSIINLGETVESYFVDVAHSLPADEDIRAQVHVVSSSLFVMHLERFRLPNEAIDIEALKPIFLQYQALLAACLVKELYSINRVVISGLKRVELQLTGDVFDTSLENLELLESAVRWVYQERCETRLLLLMDRLSLDLPERGLLVPGLYAHLEQALEQARSRYDFVIRDRKEAHAKELSDLQKDIKSVTDDFSKSANELVSGLLKDALSSIFILAIGLLSRLIGKDGVFDSETIKWLFYGLGGYLIISVAIRSYIGLKGLKLSLADLKYWKNAIRNHMSEAEFNTILNDRTKDYIKLFKRSIWGVSFVYVLLSGFAFYMPSVLSSAEQTVNSNETSPVIDNPKEALSASSKNIKAKEASAVKKSGDGLKEDSKKEEKTSG